MSKTEPSEVPAPDDVYGVDRLCKEGCRRKSEIPWSAYVRFEPVKCWSASYSLRGRNTPKAWTRKFPGITPGVYLSVHGEVANRSAY